MPSSDANKEAEDHADAVPERVLYDCGETRVPDLRILHFNDVYHPHGSEEEPKGGAARFKTMCEHYRNGDEFQDAPKPLTLFSGDAFNPSSESSVTKGSHMVPVLNELGIDAACVGNHEFDFGAAHFAYLAKDCNFPWLLANIYDPDLGTKSPMGGCDRYLMLETSNGVKVGVMGLVEKEWTEKINNSLPSDIEYYCMKETAKEIAPKLREEGADIVIAITHARQERDFDFCENIPGGVVDLVLAGHDHWVEQHVFDNGTVMVRSGFDFKNLTHTSGFRQEDGSWKFSTIRRNLTSDIEGDDRINKLCEDITKDVKIKMEMQLGWTAVPLEARKKQCQTQESNFGNFLTDLMRIYHDADCALINGGTFHGDQIFPSGKLHVKDIVNCFPFEDPIVMLRVNGQAIKDALENGVSKYPEPDARFPHVSNIFFTFDPDAEPGKRVQRVSIGGEQLDVKRNYHIATRSLIATGKCGYESLKGRSDGGDAEEVIDEENGVLVTGLIRQYFTWAGVSYVFASLAGGESASRSHRQEVIHSIGRHATRWNNEEERRELIRKKVFWKWKRVTFRRPDYEKCMKLGDGEFFQGWSMGIAPKLEGRILVAK